LLAVAAAIAVLVLVGVVGLGTPPSDDEDASEGSGPLASGEAEITTTTTTTTTTTLPPTLFDLAPVESPLMVIPDERDTLLYHWHPSAREAQWFALASLPGSPQFDASGQWLAYLPGAGDPGDLWIGPAVGTQRPQRSGVTSARWHPEDPDRLAWSGGDEPYGVRTGNMGDGSLVETDLAFALEPGTCLEAWGDWGFAVGPCDGSMRLAVHAPDGTVTGSAPLDLVSTSVSGRMLVRNDAGDFSVVDKTFELIAAMTLDPAAGLALSRDGTEVVEVAATGTGTRVRSLFVDRPGGRSLWVTGEGRLVDISRSGRFAVLHMAESGELVLVDWVAGPTFRIPGGWPRVAAAWVP
jgi:hypothetical protein